MRSLIRTLLLVGAVLAVMAPSAVAQTPPTLTGETLEGAVTDLDYPAIPPDSSLTCESGADFTAAGGAVGPYPGTFTETGRQDYAGWNPQTGQPEIFTADFRITSGSTTITGTKTANPSDAGEGVFQAFCAPNAFGQRFVGASGTYTATITTPEGTFTDEGTVITDFLATDVCEWDPELGFHCDRENPQPVQGSVTQTFTSNLTDPIADIIGPGKSGPVKPGKGCGSKKHLHDEQTDCKK